MTSHGMTLTPVGVVRNEQREATWGSGSSGTSWRDRVLREKASREAVSRIEVVPALEGAMEGVEDFSHLLILWWPNRLSRDPDGPLQVRPMGREDLPLVGVFATRSPRRPNPILCTVVKLVRRRGATLEVTGLDALDGSPVLDVKPVVPSDSPREDVRVPEWLHRINREIAALDSEAEEGTRPSPGPV